MKMSIFSLGKNQPQISDELATNNLHQSVSSV